MIPITFNLEEYAMCHIAHEIAMLASLPAHVRRHTRRKADTRGVVPNALYESLLLHARNIDDFLSCQGDQRSVKASDYITTWKAPYAEPAWRVQVNRRVAHLDRTRTAPASPSTRNPDPADLSRELGLYLKHFYGALGAHQRTWFASIPLHFGTEQ